MIKLKGLLFVATLLFCQLPAFCQDYLTGKMTTPGAAAEDILYDRTQYAINSTMYKSVYKIMDKKKTVLYTVSITQDQTKSSFVIYLRPEGGSSKILSVNYDPDNAGLIFSDAGNMDTAYSTPKEYIYLISFTDTARDYPILHKIKTDDGKQLELDPLSRLRLKKNSELVRAITVRNNPAAAITTNNNTGSNNASGNSGSTGSKRNTEKANNKNNAPVYNDITKVAEQRRNIEIAVKDTFSLHLLRLRDSLYTKNWNYTRNMNKVIKTVQTDSASAFKSKKPSTETKKYKGKKKGGKYEGKGILALNADIYDGTFKKGLFVSGKVMIHTDGYEYYGDFARDTFNGIGILKYKDGSYQLGNFRDGILYNGVILSNDKNGDVYFGITQYFQRTGYAELHDPRGCLYYGDFLSNRLITGYAKDVDRFGYSTFSKIEKGSKTFIEPDLGEKFFQSTSPLKK